MSGALAARPRALPPRRETPRSVPLPRPLLDRPGFDMSFSGLKTAVLRARDAAVAAHGGLRLADRADICAAFQQAVAEVLSEKTRRALADHPVPTLAVVTTVAALAGVLASVLPGRRAARLDVLAAIASS